MNNYNTTFSKTDEIIDRLEILDILCHQQNVQAELVVLGASGILLCMELHEQTFRPTKDIDINLLSTSDKKKIQELLQQVKIDTVGGVMQLPPMEDFKGDEIFEIDGLDFEAIKIFVPSIELLACSKIFSTREKDLEDLKKTDILDTCDKEKLMEMVDEYKDHILNPNNFDLNVYELDNIFEEKGI